MALLILSTPNMFDVAFRKWVVQKTMEFGSFDKVSELVTSPIQNFLEDRLDVMSDKLREVEENFEILHDYSMTPQRRPKILMQTCGHVAGAAFYYQPRHFREENVDWPPPGKMGPNLKFIGLSLHPTCGGHFAFRSVLIFPNVLIPEYRESVPPSILSAHEEVREALEKFNYNWKDSG
uniref:Cyanocobalamin reductase (cyanide-eliminating) n=1 Tax=Caenorhabditis japonica TaxID=281687 RepID=A0A8R1DXE8_CAEJA